MTHADTIVTHPSFYQLTLCCHNDTTHWSERKGRLLTPLRDQPSGERRGKDELFFCSFFLEGGHTQETEEKIHWNVCQRELHVHSVHFHSGSWSKAPPSGHCWWAQLPEEPVSHGIQHTLDIWLLLCQKSKAVSQSADISVTSPQARTHARIHRHPSEDLQLNSSACWNKSEGELFLNI